MRMIPPRDATGTRSTSWSPGGREASRSVGVGTLSRRVFLADLGRVTLGAVVLGPVLAGCSSGDDTDAGAGAGSEGGATAEQASASAADTAADGAATTASPTGDPADAGGAADEQGGDGEDSSGPVVASGLTWTRASYGFVSAFVLVRDGEAVVFDTGTSAGGAAPIEQALSAAGVGWDAVADVVVSHRHPDHVGGLAAVAAAAPAATVHAAMPDLDVVRQDVESAAEIVDGDVVLGLRIVATPGHTEGHLAAFDDGSGVLLAGDAIVNGVAIGGTTGDGIEASPPEFTDDPEAAAASVAVLADLRPSTILFGHGEPLTDGAAEQLAAVVEV